MRPSQISTFRAVAMFLIVGIETFQIKCIDMCINCLHAKFHVPVFQSSLVTAVKPEGMLWPRDHATANLFHNIPKKKKEGETVSAMLLLPIS
jgi:hypothetical protein